MDQHSDLMDQDEPGAIGCIIKGLISLLDAPCWLLQAQQLADLLLPRAQLVLNGFGLVHE